jgi:asparagine synthase (glutamine-hydrolysing)
VSGIYGAVGFDGRPFDADDLAGVREATAPLGPDDGGSWAGPVGRLGTALGVAGGAPLSGVDGRVVVVADAVLDNRRELAGPLGLRADAPDAAFVLAAYERWGRDCPERLHGAFAFAVADARQGGVLIARDPLGIRPLHVRTTSRELLFASTAFALTGWESVGSTVDEVRVAAFLYATVEPDRTWVAGVRPVPPATALWVDASGARPRRYWRPDAVRAEPRRDHARALREALEAAVASGTERGGDVGVILSGGLDSTSVAAVAASLVRPAPVRTYTSVPPPDWCGPALGDTEADESHLVRDLADRYPTLRPSFMDSRGLPLLDGYGPTFAAGGTPSPNVLNLTWWRAFHRRAARDGVRTLLHGGGGNFFFSADEPGWLAALVRRGRWHTAGREAVHWSRAHGIPLRRVLRGPLLVELVPAAVLERRRGAAAVEPFRAHGWVRPEHRHLVPDGRLRAVAGYGRFGAPIVFDALAAGAEATAAEEARWGLRVCDPTLDLRVIEAAYAQPPWIRRRGGRSRAVCRDAMAGVLPDSIRLRHARGLQMADAADRIADARAELVAEVEAARDVPLVRALVDLDAVGAALAGRPDADPQAFLRGGVLRVLLASRYIRWFTEHAGRKFRNVPSVGQS